MADNDADPWFGSRHLPEPSDEYVAWVDIMGTGEFMEWSSQIASVNIGKLHVAILEELDGAEGFSTYPMNDGIFLCHPEGGEMRACLGDLFKRFTKMLLDNRGNDNRDKLVPLIRCGVAKGNVRHGPEITETALGDSDIRNSLIFGEPTVNAYKSESKAPPMGIRIHQTAEGEFGERNWKWWGDAPPDDLFPIVKEYLDFHIEDERIPERDSARHLGMIMRYTNQV